MTYADVLEKIKSDLTWRGPNDRTARYVVLEREQAELLLTPESIKSNVTQKQLSEALFRIAKLENEKRRLRRELAIKNVAH
jgi:hypothetical protein